MNFAPFTGHIPTAAAIPTIHQFAAKFGYEGTGTGVVQETRYQTGAGAGNVQFAVGPASGTLSVDGVKFRQAESVVVVSSAQPGTVTLAGLAPIHTVNTGVKYQTISASSSVNLGNITYGGQFVDQRADKREFREEVTHDLMAMMQQQGDTFVTTGGLQGGAQQLLVVLHEPKEAAALARALKHEPRERQPAVPAEFISIGDVSDSGSWQALGGGVADYLSALPLPLHHLLKYADKRDEPAVLSVANALPSMPALTALGGGVADYLSALPLPLHHLLKYADKRDEPAVLSVANALPSMPALTSYDSLAENTDATVINFAPRSPPMPSHAVNSVVVQTTSVVDQASNTSPVIETVEVIPKRKKKKKSTKEKKPRPKPGEIRLTTALDGSTLYCCPECHMAYPERELLEQHLLGHTMERRFICDICNAALKRKDHLTRHKQSHNPERPHVCAVCLKAFKRKEQLTLHVVIHSGEKRHVCNECGKGFYRKDHLRKHTRSHIARRVKAELSAQCEPPGAATAGAGAAGAS